MSGSFPPSRPFQETAIRELRAGFAAGKQRQVIMAPTGAGKTHLALTVCHGALGKDPNRRALFIADRKTLINQTSAVADAYGMLPHGIIQADNPRFDLSKRFQIASAQTMAVRGFSDNYGPADVVIVDECHTMNDAVKEFVAGTKAVVIGLSATPFAKGMGKTFQGLVNAATMNELTKQEILTPMRVMSCARPDMKGAKTDASGEWAKGEAATRGMEIIGDITTEWTKHALGRKTIVFGARIDHCEAIVKQFTEIGVAAALFTAKTTDTERARLLAEYRKPDSVLRVLVSVEALAKGFDVPDVSCVADARPLRKSLSTFVQMVGRGLRSSPGKTECVLLDFSGNVVRFADDFSDLYFNGLGALDAGETLDKEVREEPEEHAGKRCPACGYQPLGRRCVACGFEVPIVSKTEHAPGEAKFFDLLGDHGQSSEQMKRDLWAMICTRERAKFQRRGDKGNPKGSSAHRFKELTGSWPPRSFPDYADVRDMASTPALASKLTSMEIAFAKFGRARKAPQPHPQRVRDMWRNPDWDGIE